MIGSSLYLLSMLSLIFTSSWVMVFMSVVLFGLGHGILIPSIQNLLVGFASIKERAAFMSFNSMVLRVGQTLGPLVIGILYTLGNLNGSFGGGALVALIMIVVVAAMVNVTSAKKTVEKSN
jgi:MFS family permease